VARALDSEFVADSQRIAHFAGPEGVEVLRMLAGPVTVSGGEAPRKAGPGLGADTVDILQGLGFSMAQIAALKNRNVV
jgi:crotonobetainyl-CoA:carnitine CoA-transferase CaiB-like acyl-CoA transferase